jgi:hypothetical protein
MGNSITFQAALPLIAKSDKEPSAKDSEKEGVRKAVGAGTSALSRYPYARRLSHFKGLLGGYPAPRLWESGEFSDQEPVARSGYRNLSSAEALAVYDRLASSFPWKIITAKASSTVPNPEYEKHLVAVKDIVNRYPVIVELNPDAARYLYR